MVWRLLMRLRCREENGKNTAHNQSQEAPNVTVTRLPKRVARNSSEQIVGRWGWSRNYAAKDVRFGVEARALMLKGVEELAKTVKVTMARRMSPPMIS